MKLVIVSFLCVFSLFGGELSWSHNYKKALLEAKREDKPLYILITSRDCRWCKKFVATTLQDKKVLQKLYHDFIVVHLLRDKDYIPKKFAISPVPRHYFVDANGTLLYSALGYRDEELFTSFMVNAQQKYKQIQGEN
jgi:thioredoxin-related protein